MAHMSRREYRMKKEHGQAGADQSRINYSKNKVVSREEFRSKKISNPKPIANPDLTHVSRENINHVKLNFWNIFSDRPYVSVAIIVLALFFIMIKLWWGLAILLLLVIAGIFIIGHSHHPNRVLSLEFHLKASRKLSMLRAFELGGSVVMFLATYMKQVVSVDFSSAGSTDSFQILQGALSNNGGYYGQQGSYFLSLLNTVTGGQLWSSYRYATNSAQMMSSNSGRWIIIWIMLLMIAPAICVLAQFFREPYSRNTTLVTSLITTVSFILTPVLMRKWVVGYAMENQITRTVANNAVHIGTMAYVGMACSILVLIIAIYRFVKQDNFE
ncbi:cytochrome C5 [Lactobacillus ultunensis]|nr:cytochrome C5 [Lactobacillus ultunensis]QQP28424.1 cytochrome C5 [Lactobacillus ultunensis]